MFEMPDRRAFLILGVLIVVGLLNALVPPLSAAARPVEFLLAASLVGGGLAFLVLDLREGYCLNRPSITRAGSPFLYSLEIAASLFLVAMGAQKLWAML